MTHIMRHAPCVLHPCQATSGQGHKHRSDKACKQAAASKLFTQHTYINVSGGTCMITERAMQCRDSKQHQGCGASGRLADQAPWRRQQVPPGARQALPPPTALLLWRRRRTTNPLVVAPLCAMVSLSGRSRPHRPEQTQWVAQSWHHETLVAQHLTPWGSVLLHASCIPV